MRTFIFWTHLLVMSQNTSSNNLTYGPCDKAITSETPAHFSRRT